MGVNLVTNIKGRKYDLIMFETRVPRKTVQSWI
jgi:hypothetical protein